MFDNSQSLHEGSRKELSISERPSPEIHQCSGNSYRSVLSRRKSSNIAIANGWPSMSILNTINRLDASDENLVRVS